MLRRYKKGIAVLLLMVFFQEICAPTVAMALTGGPSQPEVESFEPVGTNQMVDLSTGDFNYNIPLMVVPGPNGSYPINIAYHAGIGMEQEASWVGLGWNINPGAITRNLRGIPDDFKGDKITKTVSLKNDITVGLGIDVASLGPLYQETFGQVNASALPGQIQVYYNNYRGIGYNISSSPLTLLNSVCRVDRKPDNSIWGNISLSLDSQSGLGISVPIGIGDKIYKFNLHSRQGFQNFSVEKKRSSKYKSKISLNYKGSGGISFVNHTYVPALNKSMKGTNFNFSLALAHVNKLGVFNKKKKVNVSVHSNRIKYEERDLNAYGTIYLDSQSSLDDSGTDYNRIMDMNVSNDIGISENSVNMGFPFQTNDVFMITGQGIGGSFRAHRNDIGKFYKSGNVSNSNTVSVDVELGAGFVPAAPALQLYHLGGDASWGYHHSYSGKWTDGIERIDHLKFNSKTVTQPLYEPFFFKVVGEQVATKVNEWEYMQNEDPIAFEMGMKWEGTSPKPIVKNKLSKVNKKIYSRNKNEERQKRVQNIGYRNRDEITNNEYYSNGTKHIYGFNEVPTNSNGSKIEYTDGELHHIQEYSILKPDGTRYTYGLPAYNTEQIDAVFSVFDDSFDKYEDQENISYDELDASVENDEGMSHYFSSTELPSYSHANLLTQIKSTDYIDLTNNGLSEDDFGFYVKFNYSTVNDYQWRVPYANANYIKGNYSDQMDDMASYSYGKKDLHYVNSIETKTHIAIFELGDRIDGQGVSEEYQTQTSELDPGVKQKQKYLKKIKLYSKKDLENGIASAVPIQVTHFIYNYELCPGVPNNDNSFNSDDGHIESNGGGKLTLKKLYITYSNNEKGRLSPYQFSYDSNKEYSKLNIDRWGNYQKSLTANEHVENPYTGQSLSEQVRKENASAWCMNSITLPSGGELTVDYESDDYGYVQDKRAMQMVEVYGFSKIDNNNSGSDEAAEKILPNTDSKYKLLKNYRRLWFELKDPLVGTAAEKSLQVKDYLSGVDEIYFKIFEDLKSEFGTFSMVEASDYVEGYAKIVSSTDPNYYGYDENHDDYAYVDIEPVSYQTYGLNMMETHPFRKAGWQIVRYERSDLFHNQNGADNFFVDIMNNILGVISSIGAALSDVISAVGYYNKAAILGYCKRMNGDKKSFIRLNSPGHLKYGGGHRVKSVQMADNWDESARVFGTSYEYKNTDGKTSGVADYEPLIGGEENALKKPIWYNGSDVANSFKHIDAYLETPIAESVYPGARVVYGRVIQRTMNHFGGDWYDVSEVENGITVNEFYTSKEFPVRFKETGLDVNGYNLPVFIPFVGFQTFQNNGYSQGYSVFTNDMSGKSKSIETYPYKHQAITLEDEPISKIEYIYKTNNKDQLDNTVLTLDAHGSVTTSKMGVEQDFIINEEQNNSFNTNINVGANFDFVVLFPTLIGFPSFSGGINYSESMYRGISTSKTIHQTGILDQVRVYSDGSTVSTKNIMYDAETGEALLTSTNNEWDKPVYSYAYPAHWNYEGMEGAYKNYRANLPIHGNANALHIINSPTQNVIPSTILTLGDEIQVKESGIFKTYYVTQVNDETESFKLENAEGVSKGFTNITLGIISRSGKRNMQSIKSGGVQSLNMDFLNNSLNLANQFQLWNAQIYGQTPPTTGDTYLDFATNTQQPVPVWNSNGTHLTNFLNYNSSPAEYEELLVKLLPDFNSIVFEPGTPCKDAILTFEDGPGNDTPHELGLITDNSFANWSVELPNFKIIHQEINNLGAIVSVLMKHSITGDVFVANWNGGNAPCFSNTVENQQILSASAVEFTDDWGDLYPYADLGNPSNGVDDISLGTLNEYRYGKKGIWRMVKSYVTQKDRSQKGNSALDDFNSEIDKDGTFNWKPFCWENNADNLLWDWTSEITKYSPYGFALESKSRLTIDLASGQNKELYSSQLYGYNNSLVTATSSNSSYFELGYNSFEQDNTYQYRGHLDFLESDLVISNTKSHTGQQSIKLTNAQTLSCYSKIYSSIPSNQYLMGRPGKEYIASLWVNVENSNSNGTLSIGSSSIDVNSTGEIIDGWKKIELKFTMLATDVQIIYTSTGTTYIDDFRISPYDGGVQTYVYEPNKLWLVAEMDALNYATFYNYDNEGKLVQVKKETENGIVTIQTTRANTKH